ncbi:hypothetical protein Dsin_028648 [Dipteronia sinensis]|uniref:Reverse transcriptase zinc-binding domain-containing protein n=1 Tax=Dipteronia sinensis TaxID=43782 RepID=A0AAE0DVR7_9ROSI|nr:hypothetical protein Dsin_028648 [Dipteronia sinensis]
MPSYAMSIFHLPKSLIAEIHRMSARFWWGSKENQQNIHWCTWKRLCTPENDGGLGFCDIEKSNRAYLAKQCWRMIKNPDSLVVKVLKGCYYKDKSFLEAQKNGDGSYVWNILIWGKDLLEEGIRWRVSNGNSIHVYKDKWIPKQSTFKILSHPSLNDAIVDQLLTPSGNWNLQLIHEKFSSDDENKILRIPIGRGKREELIIWHYEGDGTYMVKSGYWLGINLEDKSRPFNTNPSTRLWSFFWKLKIPSKVKILIWKASHYWIPTKASIARRGIQISHICDACKSSIETTLVDL